MILGTAVLATVGVGSPVPCARLRVCVMRTQFVKFMRAIYFAGRIHSVVCLHLLNGCAFVRDKCMTNTSKRNARSSLQLLAH